jgi:hypothetical protein
VVGNSVVLAGPGHFYSIDQLSGSVNQFFNGSISGGGGTTTVYDSLRHMLYVEAEVGSGLNDQNVLTAYSVSGNNYTQAWQLRGAGISAGSSVALGPNGDVYAAAGSTLLDINPSNGNIVRSLTGLSLANRVTPVIDANDIWLFDQQNTLIYDLNTLALVKTLPGSRGSLNTAYDGAGVVSGTSFLLDYGNIYNSPGFDVYALVSVPEPSSLAMTSVAIAGLLAARSLRRRR